MASEDNSDFERDFVFDKPIGADKSATGRGPIDFSLAKFDPAGAAEEVTPMNQRCPVIV
jgi:hypothetical protein